MKPVHRIALGLVRHGVLRACSSVAVSVYQAIDAIADERKREVDQLLRDDHEKRKASCPCMACTFVRAQAAVVAAGPTATKGAN